MTNLIAWTSYLFDFGQVEYWSPSFASLRAVAALSCDDPDVDVSEFDTTFCVQSNVSHRKLAMREGNTGLLICLPWPVASSTTN